MTDEIIGERTLANDDLLAFAEASGDWNPIHTDPVTARRLLAGSIVAHGMSTLLWMLERHVASGGDVPRMVAATFARPLAPGDQAVLAREPAESGRQRLAVRLDGEEVTSAWLDLGGLPVDGAPPQSRLPREEPQCHDFAALKTASGRLDAVAAEDRDRAAYPHLHEQLGPRAIAGMMAVSRLVGMRCPGLHSLIAGVKLCFDGVGVGSDIEWAVTRHSVQQAPLRITVRGSGLEGHVDAFVRPGPVVQASYAALRAAVVTGEFAGQVALVVGGSRGLGEIAAKLIAAGGGEVIVTHREGRQDAERVAGEIAASGGHCRTVAFDAEHARRDLARIVAEQGWPSHVYYFAAPRIGRAKSRLFSAAVFRSFMQVFVEGFGQLAAGLAAGEGDVRLFYPSTVFIDELPKDQAEYVAAKAAGEALCRHLDKHAGHLRVLSLRLPRLHTDQNAALITRHSADPVPVVLDVVRTLHGYSGH